MKKAISIIILCLACIGGFKAQNYWEFIDHPATLLGVSPDGSLFFYEGNNGISRMQTVNGPCTIVIGPETGFNYLFNPHCFCVSPEGRIFLFNNTLNAVMYSDDKGDTWQQMPQVSSCAIEDVTGLYAPSNETVVVWASTGEIFWTTDNGVTWDGAIPGFMNADNAPSIGDLLVNENGDVYIGISTIDIYEGGGIYHLMLSDMQEGERVAGVGVNIRDMAFDPEGNVVACGYSGDGSSVGFQHIPGFYLSDGASLAISDNGVVYKPSFAGYTAVLSYSLDHGETFVNVGEEIPLVDIAPGDGSGYLFKGYDNYLYFVTGTEYWKSIVNADEIPTLTPLFGLSFYDEPSGLYYNITGNNTVEVTYTPDLETTGFNSYVGDIDIPETIDYECITYTVTAVGDGAFKNCNGELNSVVVPNTVTTIGESAFSSCSYLRVVVLPNSVETIGDRAFADCWPLNSVRLPVGITVLPKELFINCSSLTSIEIPSSVKHIENRAFLGTGLTSIDLPESVTHLGDSAFYYCSHLSSIDVPNTVTELGAGTFAYCYELQSVHLPENLASIPDDLFSNCQVLNSIVIPETVTEIGERAFLQCFHLTEINLPASVTSLGSSAFRACVGLTSYTIPETVRHLGNYLFQQCDRLKTVTLPRNLDTIPTGMFEECSRLDSIVIPETVVSIGAWAFSSCFALNEMVIPDSVSSIGSQAFYNCRNLSRVDLGVSVSNIAEGAFRRNNESVKLTLVCHGTTPAICGLTSFPPASLQEKLIVPCGCENIYREAWDSWQSDIEEDCGTATNEWYYEILNDDGSITYQYLRQANDTTINDKEQIHVLVRINTLYDKGEHTETSHEYIYDENDVVYWWNKELQEFTVLYDFGAVEGDEWEIKVGTESVVMHVDAVEQYEYEGRVFKMLRVSDMGNVFSGTIVRGIGHLTSFFPEKLMNQAKGYRVEGIRCFWKEDRLMFKYGEKDCDEVYEEYHDYGVEEPVLTEGLQVYPNPTTGLITITGIQSGEYRITNTIGQTLMTGRIDNENQQINVSQLPNGLYFITIAGKTTKLIINR